MLKKVDIKFVISSIILGMLTAGLQVLGYSYSKRGNWSFIIENGELQLSTVALWSGVSILFAILIYILFGFLKKEEKKSADTSSVNMKYVLLIAGVIIVCWMPYIIINYPCSFNPDVMDQLGQVFHVDKLCWTKRYVDLPNPSVSYWNNHHPVFHTWLLGVFANIGLQLGNMGVGLFLMVLVQMVLMASVFAYIVCYLYSKGVSKKICMFVCAFYSLWPLHALNVDSLCKDTLFTVFITVSTIFLLELFEKREMVLSYRKMICMIIVFTLMSLIRNNGLYLLIVMFPVAVWMGKGERKKIIISFLIPIIFIGILVPKVIFLAMNIAPGGEKEMYSVPLQQIARTLKYHEEGFSKEDLDVIETAMCPGRNYKFIQNRYNGNNADPIKATFNLNITDQERSDFFKTWFKYLKKYPTTYIQAFLNNNYEYFYYERYSYKRFERVLYYNGIQTKGNPVMGLKNAEKFESNRNQLWNGMLKIQESKWLGWTVNIGFYMCLFLLLIGYALLKKKHRLVLGFGFIISNIGINFLGPLVYMRYVYFFIVAIPLLFGLLTCREIK